MTCTELAVGALTLVLHRGGGSCLVNRPLRRQLSFLSKGRAVLGPGTPMLTMFDCIAPFAPRIVCRSFAAKIARGCCSLQFLVLCLLVGFVVSRAAAAGPGVPHVPIASLGAGPSFAVADFDSDKQLDLANVVGAQLGPGSTTYSIELHLTASRHKIIKLIAPPGGLAIEARDVNGDNVVDLVLTTAWSKRPVAVFLNHGHGRFSHVEPGRFPEAFCGPRGNWGSSRHQVSEYVDIASQLRSGVSRDAEDAWTIRGPTESVRTPISGFVFDPLLIASPDRAPPFQLSYL